MSWGTSLDKMTLEVHLSGLTFEEEEEEAGVQRAKRNVVEAKKTADAKALRQKPPWYVGGIGRQLCSRMS